MNIETTSLLISIFTAYMGIGILFSILFVFFGAAKADPAAAGMPFRVRLILIPGCAIFWPLMLVKWFKKSGPPIS